MPPRRQRFSVLCRHSPCRVSSPDSPSHLDIGSKISLSATSSSITPTLYPLALLSSVLLPSHAVKPVHVIKSWSTLKPSAPPSPLSTVKSLCAVKLPRAVNISLTVKSSIPRAANFSRRQSLICHQAHEALVGVKAWPGIMVP
ncbi:hypothetical protein B0H12DRAFT_630142 [Mycena haematopus]|nr:hypothetical protein B0H12DRAFT_630142 [Mycena haematopus]